MARARGARSVTAAAFEATYGVAPASGYFRMPFAQNRLGADQPLIDNELLGYGRDPLEPIKDALTADGDLSVPIDAQSFGFWLKGAFGDPVTSGSGPYTHVFASGGPSLPSMSIEKAMPDVPLFEMFSGCVVDRLSWTMQRTGQLRAQVDLVAQGVEKGPVTTAGALADWSLSRFGNFNGSIQRNGANLGSIVSAEVAYQNNLDRVEVIRADGKIDGVDPDLASLTGRITARLADTTLIDQATAGDPCELTFGWSLGTVQLSMVAHAVFLPVPRTQIDGPGGIQVTFDWQAAQGGSDSRLCDVTLVNDVDAY